MCQAGNRIGPILFASFWDGFITACPMQAAMLLIAGPPCPHQLCDTKHTPTHIQSDFFWRNLFNDTLMAQRVAKKDLSTRFYIQIADTLRVSALKGYTFGTEDRMWTRLHHATSQVRNSPSISTIQWWCRNALLRLKLCWMTVMLHLALCLPCFDYIDRTMIMEHKLGMVDMLQNLLPPKNIPVFLSEAVVGDAGAGKTDCIMTPFLDWLVQLKIPSCLGSIGDSDYTIQWNGDYIKPL